MKFKIIRSAFVEGLKSVQNIVPSKGSLPILQNVLIEAIDNTLKLTTTDLDITIISRVDCKVEASGITTLPVKHLFNTILKAPEGEIEIEVDDNDQALIKAGNSRTKINGKKESEFPRISQDEESCKYNIEAAVIKEMLRKTSYAASQDDTRRTLKGVLMSFKDKKLIMVATDGRRLAMVENEVEYPADFEKDIVLPSKTVQELLRSIGNEGEIKITVFKNKICLELSNVTIYSKLMEDAYPNYKQVIPKEINETVVIDRQLLIDAIDRASVMTMDEAHSIKLIFEENKLIVTSTSSEAGEAKDVVAIKYAGEKIEIMFNPGYVLDPLKVIDDNEITFNLNNGHSPAIIKCSVPFLYVLMPLRIN